MRLIFEWDYKKAASNARKHRVTLTKQSRYGDENLLTFVDEVHSDNERRFLSVGLSEKARILLVVHTEIDKMPDEIIVRIISARKAEPNERKRYENER